MKDRHVAVTGASSGIGAAIAKELSQHGAKLTLVARRRARMEALAAQLPSESLVVEHDLAIVDASTAWIGEAEAALGPIDVLINNAGMQAIGPTSQIDVEHGERAIALNLLTPLRLTRALLSGMLERGGTIVNVSSMAALAPTPGMTYYNASKAGLAAASEALRGELLGTAVHVLTVYPGIIETDMGKAGLVAYKQTSLSKVQPRGTEEKLARKVRRAITRRRARIIYPGVYHLTRWFPPFTRWAMDRFTPPLADAPSE